MTTISDECCDEIREEVFRRFPELKAVLQHADLDFALIRAGAAERDAQPVAADDAALIERLRARRRNVADASLEWEAADRIAALTASQPVASLRAALAELVACKDLKDRYTAIQCGIVRDEMYKRMRDDYNRRKPLAWAAARAALTEGRNEPT